MIYVLILLALIAAGGLLYMQHPRFGKAASGERLQRMQNSPNFKDGVFYNLEHTPSFAEGYTMRKAMYSFLMEKSKNSKPSKPLPSIRTDIKALPADNNLVVWFGHSSYYLQLDGLKFLVDPVFTNNVSPLYGTTQAFAGANTYTSDDMPAIDFLVITHDHFDHLDYGTIKSLKPKIKKVITGLGVGAHLEHWGFAPDQITETDWNESFKINDSLTVVNLPARHFSGRTFKRNSTLWSSFLLQTPTQKVLLGGDSGYGKHFADIGQKYGPIDFAIIENGQYNLAWHYIHCLPEETLRAARDLKAKNLMPVHNSKFSLALHAWNDPMKDISAHNGDYGLHLVRPMIGEVVDLADSTKVYKDWWSGIQ